MKGAGRMTPKGHTVLYKRGPILAQVLEDQREIPWYLDEPHTPRNMRGTS
jgi:hypothetical protein